MNFLINKLKLLRTHETFRNGVLFTFFSFLNSGINFFLLFVLAGFLSPQGYGKLNLFNTCLTLLAPLISLSTLGYVGVTYFQKNTDNFINIIKSIICISSLVFFLLGGISYSLYDYWEKWTGLGFDYIFYALAICFVQVFTLINLEVWRIEEKPVAYGVYSVLITGLNFFLTLLFVIYYHCEWEGRVYALLLGTGLFGAGSFYILGYKKYMNFKRFSLNYFRETLKFGIPLIPHQLSFWLRQGLDRFIINYYFTSEIVGIFSFAYNFANVIMILGTAFNATNSVYIYKNISSGAEVARLHLQKQTKLMTGFFIVVSAMVIVGAYLFSPWIFPKYTASLKYIFPLCTAAFFHCIYLLFVNYLFYFKKTKVLMNITVAVSIFHMCLSLAFTHYDVLITAYISLVSNFLICCIVALYTQRVYPIFKV